MKTITVKEYQADTLVAIVDAFNAKSALVDSMIAVEFGEVVPTIYGNDIVANLYLTMPSGYRMVTKLSHTAKDCAVVEHPSAETVGFDKLHSTCEHCNTNRFRNTTFVIKNVETGELMQVGSTCVNAFFNVDNALNQIKKAFNTFSKISVALEERFSPVLKEAIAIEELLARTIEETDHGKTFVSRAKSSTSVPATADRMHFVEKPASLESIMVARGIIQKVMSMDDSSDYIKKAKEIMINNSFVTPHSTNYSVIVSLVSILTRVEKPVEDRPVYVEFKSDTVAVKGVEAKVIVSKFIETYYGYKKMVHFEVTNSDGSVSKLVCFNFTDNVKVGDAVKIDFRIKNISDYKDEISTIITHVKLK